MLVSYYVKNIPNQVVIYSALILNLNTLVSSPGFVKIGYFFERNVRNNTLKGTKILCFNGTFIFFFSQKKMFKKKKKKRKKRKKKREKKNVFVTFSHLGHLYFLHFQN